MPRPPLRPAVNALTRRRALALTGALALAPLAGCTAARAPIRLGFLGSITSNTGDHDRAGRDGAMLAVERINAAGGVNGSPFELIVVDDEFSPQRVRDAVRDLAHQGVVGIVGPMTSRMAQAAKQAADELRIVLLSPSVSTESLGHRDDYFMRVYPQTTVATMALAESFFRSGVRLAHAVRDVTNFAHTGEFSARFFERFAALGGATGETVDFDPRRESSLSDVAERLPVGGEQKEAVLLLSTPPNVGILAQILRRRIDYRYLAASEWAASGSLIAMGGSAVEGMRVPKVYNDNDRSPETAAFRSAFVSQFFYEPSFSAACAFEAVRVFADVLSSSSGWREDLRAAIVASGAHRGLQGQFSFDAYGDVIRPMNVMVIQDGQFVLESALKKG